MRRYGLLVALLIAVALTADAQVGPSMRIVLKDEGTTQGRVGILDIVGSTVSASVSGNTGTITVSGVSNHNLLSSTHSDTSAASVVRGDMLIGNSTPAWSRLALPTFGSSPWSNGTDITTKAISFIGGFVAPTFTTSSTTYVDVTGLTTALPANFGFAFDCYGTFTTSDNAAGTTNGLGLSVNGTGGTGQAATYTIWLQTTDNNTTGNNTTSTTPFSIRNESNFDSMTALTSVITVATSLKWMMKGFYYTGTSGTSTFAVRVRSENGTPQSASVQVFSYCLFTRQG